jgi:O-6-methylguanine DNA methyltransferase
MNDLEQVLAGLRRAAPPAVETGALLGAGLVDGYEEFESPVGPVVVTFNPAGVSSVDLASDEVEEHFLARFGRRAVPASPPAGWSARIARAIELGTPGELPIDVRGLTPFQQTVLTMAATIPRGEVRPYGWLAKEVGRPGAVRAVGSTMARNPTPLIVPCHRVVRSDGTIGNYSLGGPHRKWELLRYEGSDPDLLERLASRGVRLVGSDTTGVYCHPTCRIARRITDAHRVEFASTDAAGRAGFRPCRVCRP